MTPKRKQKRSENAKINKKGSAKHEMSKRMGITSYCFPSSIDWVQRPDLNRRPFGHEPNALPNCATLRYIMRLARPTV